MNWDIIQGAWKDWHRRVQERWDKLTSDDLMLIGGSRQRLVGFLQERYGKTRDELEREIEAFCADFD